MKATRSRTSRVFTVSFPEPLAAQVEQTAREESRNISELFRDAFRVYKLQAIERQIETARRRAFASAAVGTEEGIESYVDEVRSAQFTGRNP